MSAVVAWRFASLAAIAEAWRRLMPAKSRPGALALFPARWVGESINSLLPVAQVGGDVARARLAARLELAPQGPDTAAVVVCDMTMALVVQLAFTAFAMILLQRIGALAWWSALAALALSALPLALFVGAQAFGAFGGLGGLIARLGFDRTEVDFQRMLQVFDRRLGKTYRRFDRLTLAFLWQSVGWLCRGVEVWLTLYLLGQDIGFGYAVALESAITAARTLGFVVPGGLGIQEGAALLVGGWFGLTPETALALAVVKRARELLVGLPGLLVWMILERRALKV
jgi:putative membrane protein